MQELWVLDETESTSSLVSSPEVFTVHADDGGSLSRTTTVNCMIKKHVILAHIEIRLCMHAYPLPGI